MNKPTLQSHDSSDNIKSYHTMLFHKAYDEKTVPECEAQGFTSRPDTPRPKPRRSSSTGAFIIEDDNPTLGLEMSRNNNGSSTPR